MRRLIRKGLLELLDTLPCNLRQQEGIATCRSEPPTHDCEILSTRLQPWSYGRRANRQSATVSTIDDSDFSLPAPRRLSCAIDQSVRRGTSRHCDRNVKVTDPPSVTEVCALAVCVTAAMERRSGCEQSYWEDYPNWRSDDWPNRVGQCLCGHSDFGRCFP